MACFIVLAVDIWFVRLLIKEPKGSVRRALVRE